MSYNDVSSDLYSNLYLPDIIVNFPRICKFYPVGIICPLGNIRFSRHSNGLELHIYSRIIDRMTVLDCLEKKWLSFTILGRQQSWLLRLIVALIG